MATKLRNFEAPTFFPPKADADHEDNGDEESEVASSEVASSESDRIPQLDGVADAGNTGPPNHLYQPQQQQQTAPVMTSYAPYFPGGYAPVQWAQPQVQV